MDYNSTKYLFVGHNHNNDYGGLYKEKIELVYGRKTGYGGYGPWYSERGGRVIKLNEQLNEQTRKSTVSLNHYILEENGNLVFDTKYKTYRKDFK